MQASPHGHRVLAGRMTAVGLAAMLGAALATGTAFADPPAASATPESLSCGATITESVTLSQDIDCSSTPIVNALTIGASGIRVNLNGHTIIGPGAREASSGIFDSYGGLTLENGSISNFAQDVQVSGATLMLRNLTITSTTGGWGVHGIGLTNSTIEHLHVSNLGFGIELDGGHGNTVSGNYLTDPATGLYDQGGVSNTWTANAVDNAADIAVRIQDAADDTVSVNAVLGADTAYGVVNEGAKGSTITWNLLAGLHTAVLDESGTSGLIANNVGFHDVQGVVATSSTDQIDHNVFR